MIHNFMFCIGITYLLPLYYTEWFIIIRNNSQYSILNDFVPINIIILYRQQVWCNP